MTSITLKNEHRLWFAPVQFGIVPIRQDHNGYAKRMEAELKKRGLRTALDDTGANMKVKIKNLASQKIPYMLIIGDKETKAGGFAVRSRTDGDMGFMDMETLLAFVRPALDMGKPVYLSEGED